MLNVGVPGVLRAGLFCRDSFDAQSGRVGGVEGGASAVVVPLMFKVGVSGVLRAGPLLS